MYVALLKKGSVAWKPWGPRPYFLDIQLSDGISFELFHLVTITCPIIFLTAFDQYALEAFKGKQHRLHPKTLCSRRPSKAFVQVQTFYPSQRQAIEEEVMQELKKRPLCLVINRAFCQNQPHGLLHSHRGDPVFCFEDNATVLWITKTVLFVINYSLMPWNLPWTLHFFFRINRQCLIKIDSIKKWTFSSKSRMEVVLKQQKELVSRSKTKDFRDWLDI